MKTIFLIISLQGQGYSGSEALEIRNAIEEQIEENTTSEVVGAGANTDGSEIDLAIESEDYESVIDFIKEFMLHIDLEKNYKISLK